MPQFIKKWLSTVTQPIFVSHSSFLSSKVERFFFNFSFICLKINTINEISRYKVIKITYLKKNNRHLKSANPRFSGLKSIGSWQYSDKYTTVSFNISLFNIRRVNFLIKYRRMNENKIYFNVLYSIILNYL